MLLEMVGHVGGGHLLLVEDSLLEHRRDEGHLQLGGDEPDRVAGDRIGGVGVPAYLALDHRVDVLEHLVVHRLAAQHPPPQPVDHLALLVHDVVVFEESLADREVLLLDLLLRVLHRPRHPAMLDRLPLLGAQSLHDRRDPLGAEEAHEVVFQREEEPRRARVALPARASAKLAVDAAALVAFRADDGESHVPIAVLRALDPLLGVDQDALPRA